MSTAAGGPARAVSPLVAASGLRYHDRGTGGDALVALHGSGPGVSAWSNFGGSAPAFGERFRFVAPDLPGFGASPAPALDRPYRVIAAEAVRDLLDELGIDRAHVLGNSMGGSVAAQLALDHPDRVDRLVLMGAGGLGTPVLSPAPSEGIRLLQRFHRSPSRERLVEWLEAMVSDPSVLTEELIEERWRRASDPQGAAWAAERFAGATAASLSGSGRPLWTRAREIQHPTLLIWGRDDRVVPLELALLPLRQLPHVELHVLSGCGHWAMTERPVEFQRIVVEFLERQP